MYDKNCSATHVDANQTQKTKFKLILPYQKDNTKQQTLIWKNYILYINITYHTLILCSFRRYDNGQVRKPK